MSEMQQLFLYYTFIYFLVKGGLYVALYVATVVVEKNARQRYAQLRVYLSHKRADEEVRWQSAYCKLNRRKQTKHTPVLGKAS